MAKKNDTDRKSYHFDVNTKAATGIYIFIKFKLHYNIVTIVISKLYIYIGTLNTGIGLTHLNNVLSSLNIPELHRKTFKTYENEVGPELEKMAEDSCKRATLLEKELSMKT